MEKTVYLLCKGCDVECVWMAIFEQDAVQVGSHGMTCIVDVGTVLTESGIGVSVSRSNFVPLNGDWSVSNVVLLVYLMYYIHSI